MLMLSHAKTNKAMDLAPLYGARRDTVLCHLCYKLSYANAKVVPRKANSFKKTHMPWFKLYC